jgi:hypothetical protein
MPSKADVDDLTAMDPSSIKLPDSHGRPRAKDSAALDHATQLILRVCHLAGSASFVADAGEALAAEGVYAAVRTGNTAALFDWLVSILSYQGISDQVAFDYMERHGRATWQVIASDLRRQPSCPKLQSYWHFHDCRYNKTRYTCAEPDHLPKCPLPNHWLRNGRLNQTAYALYLFIRDVAGGDLVGWIDRRLNTAAKQSGPDRLARMRTAVLDPLKEVYGVSDKILMMALSVLFLGAPGRRRRWLEVGGSMIAVDTLVHNFLHRTGILRRFRADHAYGLACYRPGGCAEIIETVAEQIDARQFNRRFPRTFPRFVQHAMWRYCSQQGLDICNGNQIDDRKRCDNIECSLYSTCDRKTLYKT